MYLTTGMFAITIKCFSMYATMLFKNKTQAEFAVFILKNTQMEIHLSAIPGVLLHSCLSLRSPTLSSMNSGSIN